MARSLFLLLLFAFALLSSMTSAAVVEHTFNVGNLTIERLCHKRVITAVNGEFPGPRIRVREGDTVIVHVFNKSPYNLTIHWHGVFQLLSAWADGPEYITQCPILPGNNYTYKFNITKQEGTLWWHAHFSWLRATVYGPLIIHPRSGRSFPYEKPYKEVPILLGEWWNANVIDVENEATMNGGAPNISDAFTINGQPGDLYPCSKNHTYKLTVVPGKTYLLRIINVALNNQLFFKIADHNLTVVGIDASYTEPYHTDVVVIAPGQTTDVLLTANRPSGRYYMAAHPYNSAGGGGFDNTTTTGIIQYEGATSSIPQMPNLPAFNDTPTAHKFYSNLTSLIGGPHWIHMPNQCDERMFVTEGLGLVPCEKNTTCAGPNGFRFAASMNNASFQLPSRLSLLQAYFFNVSGIYTADFPDQPPVVFDYTNTNNSFNVSLLLTNKGTRVKKLKYNTTVEMVLQNTALIGTENHPVHLHGFNFFVVGQGFGNYNSTKDANKFNLVNPQQRNTIAVPVGGWAAIRFQANNPGVWFMHCHLDVHLSWGFATAFVVENGPTPSSTLPPPPPDLPQC
ncbi:laccase-7-like [Macadamia integrifolia]|uniref:laccase-7-like n=1 Tax=Macadamia integrifolia TaxID=60698 RepID=UPI001C4F4AA6|nr:laccase-7-like [Macadamia integrifolia]